MKKIPFLSLTLFLVIGFTVSSQAQTATIRKADKALEAYNYEGACKLYQKAYRKVASHAIAQRIAECYRKQELYEDAEAWYATTVEYSEHKPLDSYYYAFMLRINGKYQEAIEAYQGYQTKGVVGVYDDPTFIESCQRAIDMLQHPTKHIVSNMLKYNTHGSDFGLTQVAGSEFHVSDSGLQMLDRRAKKVSGLMGRGFLNIYENTSSGFKPLFRDRNDKDEYHIYSPSLSADGNEIYYAVSRTVVPKLIDMIVLGKDVIFRGEIFSRRKNANGSWGPPIPFQYNDRNRYSVGDPYITADGQYLFFISDMSGGRGSLDIYYCKREGDRWSFPKNAGGFINTRGNERFPSFDAAGNFYFTSDGHVGFGGLDIYKAKFVDDVFSDTHNMGVPINSSYDDFGISFTDATSGFFASNREDGVGSDDIYSFVLQFSLQLTVKDSQTEAPLVDAAVLIDDSRVKENHRLYTDSLGQVKFTDIKSNNGLNVTVSRPSYFTERLQNQVYADLNGQTILLSQSNFPVTVRDKETKTPIPLAEVVIHDQSTGNSMRRETDEKGSLTVSLDRDRLYDIQGIKDTYLPTTLPNQSYVAVEPIVIDLQKIEVGTKERIDDIYYDYDDYRIRSDAVTGLDYLVELMNRNPTMRIELAAHTDSRGSVAYNLILSQRRADEAMNYLINKGISKNRIIAVGYGFTRLVNECTAGAECTEAQHQLNRRTEFTVLEILH